ncbi:MAG TPA: S8 family serine peptidase [Streptosporangiaceae bacterium]
MRAWRNRHLVAFLSFVIAGIGVAAAPAAAAAPAGGHAAGTLAMPVTKAAAALPRDERRVCPQPTRPGQLECQAVYQLAGSQASAKAFVPGVTAVPGYGPASLQSAYGLTQAAARKGSGKLVAVVDAYSDPHAASDLAAYRQHFHLPACTTASHCLRIINQNGKSKPLPRANTGWAVEESLDLDMVSASCPRCRLLLVESNAPTNASLGRAENAAIAAGARFVSNSWSGTESRGQWVNNHFFNHPGDAIVFAAGDSGYGTVYPADLQFVTAVGGTTLRHRSSGGRPWTETAWGSTDPAASGGTGSGCSPLTAKPSWQRQPVDVGGGGCPTRTENDVSAVANPATGVAVYDTYQTHGTWAELGGTSAAAPLITGVYALAGYPAPRTYPASYPYQHPAHIFDVTSGVNGVCPAASAYLCHAERGYDGPTGLGTPNGTYEFSSLGTKPVSLVDPGSKTVAAGGRFSLAIIGLDARPKVQSLTYTATGLPSGLSVRATAGTTHGLIKGTVSAGITSGTVFSVVVTATDRVTKARGVTRFTITVS